MYNSYDLFLISYQFYLQISKHNLYLALLKAFFIFIISDSGLYWPGPGVLIEVYYD